MKVLVVFDTVSANKMTGQVAETITKTLKENGVDVDSSYVKNVDAVAVKNYDCLFAGAPTMAFRPSTGIMEFLNGLADGEFSGTWAAPGELEKAKTWAQEVAKTLSEQCHLARDIQR